jgi:hypothetical protein
MNCPHCGGTLQQRNRTRLVITGAGFLAAALLLVILIHLAVVFLAGVVLVAIGAYFVAWAIRSNGLFCQDCGRVPKQVR